MDRFFNHGWSLDHGCGLLARRLMLGSAHLLSFGLAALGVGVVLPQNDAHAWESPVDRLKQQMYQRSPAMLAADQQAVTHVATTLLQQPRWQKIAKDWRGMSVEEKRAALAEVHLLYVSQFAQHGVTSNPVVTMGLRPQLCLSGILCSIDGAFEPNTDVEHKMDTSGKDRVFTRQHRDASTIYWNEKTLPRILGGGSFEDAVNTIVHESTHSVQHQLAQNKRYTGTAGQGDRFARDAATWQRGKNSYAADSRRYLTYLFNPLEVHAFSNGDCTELALKRGEKIKKRLPELRQPIRAIVSQCLIEHQPGETTHRRQSTEELRARDKVLEAKSPPAPPPAL